MTHSAITQNIKITAEPQYQNEVSDMENNHFFAYKIQIENNGEATVQLEKRHWRIFDGGVLTKEVSGEGVVGDLPILSPGESYAYSSWCAIQQPVGRMEGYYTFRNVKTQETLKIEIPTFDLVAGFVMN